MKRPVSTVVTLSEEENDVTFDQNAAKNMKYLFTTKTCPNCKIAKESLQGTDYILIDAEENAELVEKYGVMQAPTLVVIEDGAAKKYVNASNIKRYAESCKGVNV